MRVTNTDKPSAAVPSVFTSSRCPPHHPDRRSLSRAGPRPRSRVFQTRVARDRHSPQRQPSLRSALALHRGRRPTGVETVDINHPEQVTALRQRLASGRIDILFVNAGISNGLTETVPLTSTDVFTTLMVTSALSPMQVIETFADLVPPDGVIAAMSSGLGSVTNNTRAGWEIYRASKAALNTLLRSFAIRRGEGRTVLAMTPGWVITDTGGPNAPLDLNTSVRGMVDAIAARPAGSGIRRLSGE